MFVYCIFLGDYRQLEAIYKDKDAALNHFEGAIIRPSPLSVRRLWNGMTGYSTDSNYHRKPFWVEEWWID